MENYQSILPIAPLGQMTVENVQTRMQTDAPKAATFGIQVSIFVLAVLMAIAFLKFFLNTKDN